MRTNITGLHHRPRVFIGGAWADSRDGRAVDVCSPATGEPIGTARLAGTADVDLAVEAARSSFEAGTWRRRPAVERAAVLRAAADHLEGLGDAVVDLLTSELGCPRSFAARAHVPNPIRHLRYYADLIERTSLEEVREDGSYRSLVVQEPAGVVAAITPWNGPLSGPALKVAPALAAGCSVVLKPPPETPLTAYLLADAFAAAGLDEGVLSVLPADREVGEYLVRHPQVDKVAFTGSTAAGKRIMALCADRVARVTLELGGKSAAVVLDDADIDVVVRGLVPMAMSVNGQLCISQSRVLVPHDLHTKFIDALSAAVTALVVGDPFDPATDIGPLVSDAQRHRVEGYLELGRSEGARVVGGGRPPGLDSGHFVNPAVLTDVHNGMRVVQEEIFGPVMAVIPYGTEEDAVAVANDSVYGLSGSVWSADPDRALAVARRIRTGMVSVNGAPQAFGTPFGGFKQSGVGREMGPEGLRGYLEPKSIALGRADH
ncbi:aldehyde dehydrogenase [Streptomyces adelaidensis]|uniref:aldehyde dehydrogenase n=1 Tax=Streptomyces adelaidensis TaxID=2796465 RepID=UPI0027DC71F1|nr:aldehyde dehydrogenase [Streptomyces adelaidensis]